jgi:3-oxoadipate enol-lactonase / 4-carboxymuconolactone decarboxylase
LPFCTIDNTKLFYRLEGREDLPVLALSHSLGCDHQMWAPQMPDLLEHFQVLRYDTRGHGASAAPAGDYALDQLGRDALGLAASLKIEKFAWCGLSMGGAIGQWLALETPERLSSLILASTAPKFGTPELWDARRKAVSDGGMQAIVEVTMQRFFSAEILEKGDPYAESTRRVFLGTDREGYLGCCAALRDVDFRSKLAQIRVPTLVIGGDNDPSTPWTDGGAVLAREIPSAKAVLLRSAHLSNLGKPRSFTTAMLEFLLSTDAKEDLLEKGLRLRRQVLGEAHVERSMSGADDFTRDFQQLITRYAWGEVWNRPGLDVRTRRLLVLVITAAMGRWEEFRLHVRAALEHGLEACDIREALLQTVVYAGAPAANSGFKIAREEMEKLEAAQSR